MAVQLVDGTLIEGRWSDGEFRVMPNNSGMTNWSRDAFVVIVSPFGGRFRG
ncbi:MULTISPECIES: hypothetical protein [Mycobacteroides]|uniref:hypothetical protein n=1 Tax=Mycobacteroides TaxID=670516 RepID=UPI0013F4DFC5|nr:MULTISPECIES: hypothetical protein [Mycobacteroides]